MRPDPHHDPLETDNGRIIHLGEVRRRRSMRRRAPDRHYLTTMLLIAAGAWGVWLLVLLTLAPARLLTYLAFFIPLGVAVASTGSMIAYGLEWRAGYAPRLSRCLRRGALLAYLVVLNLAVLPAHAWNPILGVISLGGAVLGDMIFGGALRKR